MNYEAEYSRALTGNRMSVLMTDAYKLSMAQAGFPLREETFTLTLRKGGPFYIPFDFEVVVQTLVAALRRTRPYERPVLTDEIRGIVRPDPSEEAFLREHGFGITPAMEKALRGEVTVKAAPKGSWVLAGEPVLTITGPSFLVSWLEPLVIMFHFPIQIATELKNERGPERKGFATTCDSERGIIFLTAHGMGVETPGYLSVDDAIYRSRVGAHADLVVQSLGGEGARAFEVGLRAATCMEQHLIALDECLRKGITKTSNVWGAYRLDMVPVGSTGHEHQQRWSLVGGGDEPGFRAIRDMRPGIPSYLFDAFDPMALGIPAAVRVMREDLTRKSAVRFDSGDQDAQLDAFLAAEREYGIAPTYIFEDGYTAEKALRNEARCRSLGIPAERCLYGFGGYLVSKPYNTGLDRDRVSAAFKLSMSGGFPTMKFSGSPGKASIPGKPVILRYAPDKLESVSDKHLSLIAQEGEVVPGYAPLDPTDARQVFVGVLTDYASLRAAISPQTAALMDRLESVRVSLKSAA